MRGFDEPLSWFEQNNLPLWVYKGKEIFTSDIRSFQKAHSGLLENATDSGRIALHIDDPVFAANAMVLLAGNVEHILMLSTELDKEIVTEFLSNTKTGLLVTDTDRLDGVLPPLCAKYDLNAPQAASSPARDREPIDTVLICHTSGTTGVPKMVPHTISSLTRTARFNREKGKNVAFGGLYELIRFSGQQVFLQCILGGSKYVITHPLDTLENQIGDLAANGCTALSATPTMWRKVLMCPSSDHLPLRQITIGGEIVDERILGALKKKYPQARISQAYGTIEAGIAFLVTDGEPGFPASFLETPPPGVQLKIDDEGFLFLKMTGPTPGRYLHSDKQIVTPEGLVQTGDLVERRGDRFIFLGRANKAINVGGNKVHPEEVERVISQFGGVAGVRVQGKRNSITGQLVSAEIQVHESIRELDTFKKELVDFCSERMERFKVPRIIKFVDEIEVNLTGKMRRE